MQESQEEKSDHFFSLLQRPARIDSQSIKSDQESVEINEEPEESEEPVEINIDLLLSMDNFLREKFSMSSYKIRLVLGHVGFYTALFAGIIYLKSSLGENPSYLSDEVSHGLSIALVTISLFSWSSLFFLYYAFRDTLANLQLYRVAKEHLSQLNEALTYHHLPQWQQLNDLLNSGINGLTELSTGQEFGMVVKNRLDEQAQDLQFSEIKSSTPTSPSEASISAQNFSSEEDDLHLNTDLFLKMNRFLQDKIFVIDPCVNIVFDLFCFMAFISNVIGLIVGIMCLSDRTDTLKTLMITLNCGAYALWSSLLAVYCKLRKHFADFEFGNIAEGGITEFRLNAALQRHQLPVWSKFKRFLLLQSADMSDATDNTGQQIFDRLKDKTYNRLVFASSY